MKKHAYAHDDAFVHTITEYPGADQANDLHCRHQGDNESGNRQRITKLPIDVQYQVHHDGPDDQQRGPMTQRHEPKRRGSEGLTGGEVSPALDPHTVAVAGFGECDEIRIGTAQLRVQMQKAAVKRKRASRAQVAEEAKPVSMQLEQPSDGLYPVWKSDSFCFLPPEILRSKKSISPNCFGEPILNSFFDKL